MFESFFRCSAPAPVAATSSLTLTGLRATRPPEAGVYNEGLLTIWDSDSSRTLLNGWAEVLGRKCTALMTTGFGDVLVWDHQQGGVAFLEVQRNHLEFIGSDADWLLNEFLMLPGILEKVLRQPLFEAVQRRNRALRFREAFILEPWRMLGGQEDVENFTIGDCAVYLSLVSQSLWRVR